MPSSFITVLMLAGGIWCLNETAREADYCPGYHSAIWIPGMRRATAGIIDHIFILSVSAFFILNSILGLISSKLATINFYLAHLVISLLCVVMCVVGGALAARL